LRPGELLRAVRAIDAEVLPRDGAAQARLLHHRGEEPVGDLLAQEPLAILGERAVVETQASMLRSRKYLKSRS
jgi:hypothetical protein